MIFPVPYPLKQFKTAKAQPVPNGIKAFYIKLPINTIAKTGDAAGGKLAVGVVCDSAKVVDGELDGNVQNRHSGLLRLDRAFAKKFDNYGCKANKVKGASWQCWGACVSPFQMAGKKMIHHARSR